MKQTGLTLLEVMVALLVFALAGTAVVKATGEHLNAISQLEEITFATWVANNRLAQIQIEQQWPPKNNEKGTQEMANRTWHWQQRVLDTNDEDLRAIEIIVALDRQYEQTITAVTSYVAKPTS